MDLRAFWWARQGLDGSAHGAQARQVFARYGWARSLGGSNPYLTVFARAGLSRAQVDRDVADLAVHELPSARGCAYVLPSDDFALGLRVGVGANARDVRRLQRLGVAREELDVLADDVVAALDEPLTAQQLRAALGARVRNLGAAGRRRGLHTALPTALGVLQSAGRIRRMSLTGRLDQQDFVYTRWDRPSDSEEIDDAIALIQRYFHWIGAATVAHIRWFTGFSAMVVRRALRELDAIDVRAGLYAMTEDVDDIRTCEPAPRPQYRLVSALDSCLLLLRDFRPLLNPEDAARTVPGSELSLGELVDLSDHPILDRGRVVGLWQFDADRGDIAWQSFLPADDDLVAEISRTETYLRTELGDHRYNALDSPRSRAERIANLRAQRY